MNFYFYNLQEERQELGKFSISITKKYIAFVGQKTLHLLCSSLVKIALLKPEISGFIAKDTIFLKIKLELGILKKTLKISLSSEAFTFK